MDATVNLYAPADYWTASQAVRDAVANGCGPYGWKLDFISNFLFGLDVSEACKIHDWMYVNGQTLEDKETADRVFLNNCLRMINATDSCWSLAMLRSIKARSYYLMVKNFGGPAFWRGKNMPENMGRVVLKPKQG